MSKTLPRTAEEAVDRYIAERGHGPFAPASDVLAMNTARWFFDMGKMAGIQDATKHLGPYVKSTRSSRGLLAWQKEK